MSVTVLVVACATDRREAANCAPGTEPIEAVLNDLIVADNAANLDRVLMAYTDAVVWLPPTGDALVGKAAIRPRYEQLFRDFRPSIQLDIHESIDAGSLGVVRGRTYGELLPVGTGEAVTLDDKFLAILECQDLQWRISHLAWSPRRADR